MKKILTLWIWVVLSAWQAKAQSLPVELYQLCYVENDTLSVELLVSNFYDMSSFQMSIDFNNSELEYVESTNFNVLSGFDEGMINVTDDKIRAIWSHPIGETTSLPAYSSIVTFRFALLTSSFSSPVITDDPLFIEFNSGSGVQEVISHLCGEIFAGQVSGQIEERSSDCTVKIADHFNRYILVFTNSNQEQFFCQTDQNGKYSRYLPEGNYEVSILHLTEAYSVCQAPSVQVEAQQSPTVLNIGLVENKRCSHLKLNINAPNLRQCADNRYTVHYENLGSDVAQDAFIQLMLDIDMSIVDSEIPFVDVGNLTYRFDIGDVAAQEEGQFSIDVHLDCDNTIMGETHCIVGRAFPDEQCDSINPAWSGAHVEARAICDGDSVRLVLKNTGTAPMALDRSFIVVEDDISFMKGEYNLNQDQEQGYAFEANGQTWRIVAEQEILHPIEGYSTAVIEGCSQLPGTFSLGYVTQFRENDYEDHTSIICLESTNSINLNDKTAYPKGMGALGLIEPDQILTYTINFQNVGTDTAFNVLIKDSLSEHLDVTTFKVVQASHPYELEWRTQRELLVRFNNINLPDSTTNRDSSHGFFKFEVRVLMAVPLGTEVTNNAEIFFDFNEAVHTSTTLHTLQDIVVTSVHDDDLSRKRIINCYPNPSVEQLILEAPDETYGVFHYELLDNQGRILRAGTFEHDEKHTLSVHHLPAGQFHIRISRDSQLLDHFSIVVMRK